ncbi:MAG: carbohydrate ABC transporter permease, partial [Oscillospiraceae bacterium]
MNDNKSQGGSLRRRNMHLGSHAVLIGYCIVVIFPLYVMLVNSFKGKWYIYENPFGLPDKWHFSNYTDVLSSSDFGRYFLNSFVVVVISLTLVLVLGTMVSYALSQWKGRWSSLMFLFFMIGMMLPIKIASIKLLNMMRAMGLLNTIWALVPIYVAMGLPIAVFILTEFIRQIPRELTEAALIDGSGRFSILVRIIVPMLRPALATVGIYNLVPFWNDLWFPLIFISDEKSKTLLLGVTRLFGQYQTDWPKVLAVLTLSSLPVMALYLLMSRQFIKGMTAG